MAARLLLPNSTQSTSGYTSPRKHYIIIIYHDKHLVLFIKTNHSIIPPHSFIRDPLLHHGLPFPAHISNIHPPFLITFIRDGVPPSRINTLLHTLSQQKALPLVPFFPQQMALTSLSTNFPYRTEIT
jgi:hypothetical protein